MNIQSIRDALENELSLLLLYSELRAVDAPWLYIVLASETEVQFYGDWLGATSPAMAGWLRYAICPRWVGRGPALMLNDGLIADAETAAAVVAHEVAHILTRDCLFSPYRVVRRTRSPHARPPRIVSEAAKVMADPTAANEDHDAGFLRAMLHIRHRLVVRGWIVPADAMLEWERFTGRDADEFLKAIGDEPKRLAHLPISQALQTEPPIKFSALWTEANVATAMTCK